MVILPSLFLFLLLNINGNTATKNEPSIISMPTNKLQTYIVHVKKPEMGVLGETPIDLESWHMSFLEEVAATSIDDESPYLLYSYRNVMSGFSARLTPEQVKAMEKNDGFISAIPDSLLELHTTHTPNYLGLNQQSGFWKDSNFGKGVIIGVLDTGVTPGHPSFNDEGMPPPPAKWKGRCELKASECNNKLIGARTFHLANELMVGESPVDENGHGTHTASTAAGAFVEGANVLGNANGTAIGIAPLAHVAIYKVCSVDGGCSNSDIFAGLDAAIDDGVDVLSISLGGPKPTFFSDPIAVGTYAAIRKGIFVSCSAGNAGPSNSTLSNDAPWILTVAASTSDRRIVAVAKLGNGDEYEGESLFQPNNYSSPFLPLVYPGQNGNQTAAAICRQGSLDNIDVKGKIVVCEVDRTISNIVRGFVVKNAGGAAMILINQQQRGFTTFAENHVLPTTYTTYVAGLKIKSYIKSTKNPSASILFKGTIINRSSSSDPAVAFFSSRGPSLVTPGILKPDITGPGVNILAAWPVPLDKTIITKSTFNMISGTSMSCPHLSGIAALIKSYHPEWSPAAIKSAIMTTANITNTQGGPIWDQDMKPANFFAMGAGHVNPAAAADPGLVYDIQPDDYIPYLCGLYKDAEVSIIVGRSVVCSQISKIPEGQLNYPSFFITLRNFQMQTFTRTVTNVGAANSVYWVNIEPPTAVRVRVRPQSLSFSEVNQKLKYTVTFIRSIFEDPDEFAEGYIKWVSGKYVVRSPISVKFVWNARL